MKERQWLPVYLSLSPSKKNSTLECVRWKELNGKGQELSFIPSDSPPGTKPQVAYADRSQKRAQHQYKYTLEALFTMSPQDARRLPPTEQERLHNMRANSVLSAHPEFKVGSSEFKKAMATWENSKLSMAEEYAISAVETGNKHLAMPTLQKGTPGFAMLEKKATMLGYEARLHPERKQNRQRLPVAAQQAQARGAKTGASKPHAPLIGPGSAYGSVNESQVKSQLKRDKQNLKQTHAAMTSCLASNARSSLTQSEARSQQREGSGFRPR